MKKTRLPAQKIIHLHGSFDMMACLTTERVRLVQTVRGKPLSITSLAEELGRNRGAVTRDVKMLAELGLVRLRRETNPGHGIVTIVEPVAHRLALRANI